MNHSTRFGRVVIHDRMQSYTAQFDPRRPVRIAPGISHSTDRPECTEAAAPLWLRRIWSFVANHDASNQTA